MKFTNKELKIINNLLGDDKFKNISMLETALSNANVICSKGEQYYGQAELLLEDFKKMLFDGKIIKGKINDDCLFQFETNQQYYYGSTSRKVHIASGNKTNSRNLVLILNNS
jgi:hypothetical protein